MPSISAKTGREKRYLRLTFRAFSFFKEGESARWVLRFSSVMRRPYFGLSAVSGASSTGCPFTIRRRQRGAMTANASNASCQTKPSPRHFRFPVPARKREIGELRPLGLFFGGKAFGDEPLRTGKETFIAVNDVLREKYG